MNFGRTYGVGTSAPVDPLIDLAKSNANGGRGVAYAQFVPSSSQLSGWIDSASNFLNSGTYSLSGNTVNAVASAASSLASTISKAPDKVSAAISSLITPKEDDSYKGSIYSPNSSLKSVDDAIAEYKTSGNRIGSDGSAVNGGNFVTPSPTQKPYTSPVSSVPPASSASGVNLLSVLSAQNAILQSGLAAIALAAHGGTYAPSGSASSAPSNSSSTLKKALDNSGMSGSAQWSADGNSLTVTPNAVNASGISRAVMNGHSVSQYDLPIEVKNAAQNFYSDLGLTALSEFESGIKNAAYMRDDLHTLEGIAISQYLSGEISSSEARDRISRNRFGSVSPLSRTVYDIDPKTNKPKLIGRTELVSGFQIGEVYSSSSSPVSGSSVVGSPSAQAPVINIPAPVINVPPIEIAAPTVNVSVPAAPSTPVTVENKIDFTELTAAVRTIPQSMPQKEKIEAVADLKKESLEYDKEAKTHVISGFAVSASPREDRAAYHAQAAKLAYDKNDFQADDVDFGLDDMLSSIAHIDYSGVYSSVMNAMNKIKSGQVDYTPSIPSDFITYSYYWGA